MAHRLGLDRFKKAQSAEPFKVDAMHVTSFTPPAPPARTVIAPANGQAAGSHGASPSLATSVGGGASTWQPPEWATDPKPGVYSLEVLKDGKVVDTILLEKKRAIFGRQAATCDFVLDHPSLSRQHAALVHHKNGRMYVMDLGSVHGTFVSNERVARETPAELEPGQSVRFAASTRAYVLRKASPLARAFVSEKPLPIKLPSPPDPEDNEGVLSYNTMLNRLGVAQPSNQRMEQPSLVEDTRYGAEEGKIVSEEGRKRKSFGRLTNKDGIIAESGVPARKKAKNVCFRDECGGELAVVVGVSDGVSVCAEPGPVGGKEGSSLVGKFDSLVQTIIIPRDVSRAKSPSAAVESPRGDSPGVTDSLKQYLNRVKSPGKGGLYGGLLPGNTNTAFVGGSWGGLVGRSVSQQGEKRSTEEEERSRGTPDLGKEVTAASVSGNVVEADDDDLFGDENEENTDTSIDQPDLKEHFRNGRTMS